MTFEEALKEYDEVLIPEVVTKFSNPKCGLFPKIREALENRIEVEPVEIGDSKYCPKCTFSVNGEKGYNQIVGQGDRIMFWNCPNCGQAIKWRK